MKLRPWALAVLSFVVLLGLVGANGYWVMRRARAIHDEMIAAHQSYLWADLLLKRLTKDYSAMRGSIDERVARLPKVLQLDEGQQSAVKKILEQRHQEFWRIRRAPSLSGNERIDRVRALQQITVEPIRGVLNDEQKTKYYPLAVPRLQPAPEQHSVEDWLIATTKP